MPTLLCYNCIQFTLLQFHGVESENDSILASPLMVALIIGDEKLSELITRLRFLNMKDLYFRRKFMDNLSSIHSQPMVPDTLMMKYYSSPWSLETLSFVQVSTMLGYRSERRERVSALPLPDRFKRQLMFEVEQKIDKPKQQQQEQPKVSRWCVIL